MKYVILLISIIQFCVLAATITGTVKNKSDKQANNLASVSIKNLVLDKGVVVDGEGKFIIEGVPLGKYLIRTNAMGYVSQIDSIFIQDSLKTYHLEIYVSEAIIESNTETEKYHLQLQNANATKPIMTLTIEYFTFRNGIITVYPSIKNNSNIFFTVLRAFECINYYSAVIIDSNGKEMQSNSTRTDCVGEKIFPTRDDLIRIPEMQIVDCPPVKLYNYDFNLIPEGIYSLRLKYKYEKPPYLCCQNFNPDYQNQFADEINTLITTLRGEYISTNKIKFENKH